jgi:NAD(P)-dependent dehydrogenase (short-subunit alcohol dehydrogenase family)
MTDMDSPREEMFAYCMSKAAVNMESRLIQNCLARDGVKVLAIHPGWLRSYITGKLNMEATVEPADAAAGIFRLIREQRDPAGHMYYKYDGKEMHY